MSVFSCFLCPRSQQSVGKMTTNISHVTSWRACFQAGFNHRLWLHLILQDELTSSRFAKGGYVSIGSYRTIIGHKKKMPTISARKNNKSIFSGLSSCHFTLDIRPMLKILVQLDLPWRSQHAKKKNTITLLAESFCRFFGCKGDVFKEFHMTRVQKTWLNESLCSIVSYLTGKEWFWSGLAM